jgi:hypothetical protein
MPNPSIEGTLSGLGLQAPLMSNVRPHRRTLPMHKALIASVTALAGLGLVGGCLIVAGSGFTTSYKRAHWQVFVPVPQAYIMAAIMFALSGIAVLWLLQQAKARSSGLVVCAAAYVGVAVVLTRLLSHALQ